MKNLFFYFICPFIIGFAMACNGDSSIDEEAIDLENADARSSGDYLVIPSITDFDTYFEQYNRSESYFSVPAPLTNVALFDSVLYRMMNDEGEIQIGNKYFRFFDNSHIAICSASDDVLKETIRSWESKDAFRQKGVKIMGLHDTEEVLYEYVNGQIQDKDIVEPIFEIAHGEDTRFDLSNHSFVSVINQGNITYKWLVNDIDLGGADRLSLDSTYIGSKVRLQVLNGSTVIGESEEKELEVRGDPEYCDHAPYFGKVNDCTMRVAIRTKKPYRLRLLLPNGVIITGNNVPGIGTYADILGPPPCVDGKIHYQFQLINAAGDVVCHQSGWTLPCWTCDCRKKQAKKDEHKIPVNGKEYKIKTKLWVSHNIAGVHIGSYTDPSEELDKIYVSFEANILRDRNNDCEDIVVPFHGEEEYNSSYIARNINLDGTAPRYIPQVDLIKSTHHCIIQGQYFDLGYLILD